MPEQGQGAEAANDPQRIRRKRKRRRSKHEENPWEQEPPEEVVEQSDRGRLVWQLVAGTVVFAVMVIWVALTFREKPKTQVPGPVDQAAGSGQEQADKPESPGETDGQPWYDSDEIKAVCRAFLEAGSVDDLLDHVRNRDELEEVIRRYYSENSWEAPGMRDCSITASLNQNDIKAAVASVATKRSGKKQLFICETKDGLKVDWESWVGHSEMAWQDIMKEKPTRPVMVRAVLSHVDYYNMEFRDDRRWKSYRLVSADGEHVLYAYIDMQDQRQARWIEIISRIGLGEFFVTLTIRYPEGSASHNQVMIGDWITDGWFQPLNRP